MEDYAQISSRQEDEKDKGSLEELATWMKKTVSSPRIEYIEFFKRLLFCFVTGNGDMHFKNWSLISSGNPAVYKLAPVYDFLNVRASMPMESVESVLSICGKQTDLNKDDFINFAAKSLSLKEIFITDAFAQIPLWLKTAEELCSRSALSAKLKDRYMQILRDRGKRLST